MSPMSSSRLTKWTTGKKVDLPNGVLKRNKSYGKKFNDALFGSFFKILIRDGEFYIKGIGNIRLVYNEDGEIGIIVCDKEKNYTGWVSIFRCE